MIAFPCLMYLASVGTRLSFPLPNPLANFGNVATGIMVTYQMAQPSSSAWATILLNFSIPDISISVSLNVLLTLMIVIRLVLHSRSIRTATGSSPGISGLYTTIATMLVESSTLYAVTSLLLIGLWAAGNRAAGAVLVILAEIQARVFP